MVASRKHGMLVAACLRRRTAIQLIVIGCVHIVSWCITYLKVRQYFSWVDYSPSTDVSIAPSIISLHHSFNLVIWKLQECMMFRVPYGSRMSAPKPKELAQDMSDKLSV